MTFFALSMLFAGAGGCTAVQRISDTRGASQGFLRLDVEPGSTRIYIDSNYRGVVEGWVAQTVLLKPGLRRVELRADGFMTRRFDIHIESAEQIDLIVNMEPVIDQMDDLASAPDPGENLSSKMTR